jgi:hypothetical protein
MTHRHHILRISATVIAAAAVAASSASAMPRHDTGSGHTATHRSAPVNPARIDAAAHAATMRAIGAKRVAQSSR